MSISADSIMFDVWSATYDRPGLQQTTYRPIHDAILERLDDDLDRPDVRVLDLGCATGQMTRRLASAFPSATVIGLDLSPKMIERAAETDEGADDVALAPAYAIADAVDLPLPSASIDLVVCTESFHWYHDQQAALDGLFEILRPGGRLMIASIATVTGIGDDALREATALAGRPVRAIPKRRMRELMSTAGFEVTHQGRIVRFGFLPWPVLTDARRP